ncbi:MAG: cation diffusion facilitator family transporter [Defluviitaleaceae bacterium]|nr:cation diffusion facilitator family transporter [Defluviitaleaceae bacterium]
MNKTNQQIAMRAGRNSIIINIILSAFKLFAGIFANSAAMISDAVHSIADLFSTVVALIGIKLAGKEADKDHPYGHERFECVATLILAVLVLSVGIGIGWAGIQRVIAGNFGDIAVPGILALIAAVVSIGVKEGVYWYMRAAAKKIDSTALMADAWHSRADGLSSIGSFIGILGAMLGFPIMDSIAAIIISAFIIRTAIGIGVDALKKMTDRAADDETLDEMRKIILKHECVVSIDQLKTRLFGNKIHIDLEISVDADYTLQKAHDAAHDVQDAIQNKFPKVTHCTVHVNPAKQETQTSASVEC